MHLAANAIRLGLGIARQEVSQLLVDFGNCLVMSLLEFLKHLLGLLNLHLADLNINVLQDSVLQPSSFKEILQGLRLPLNSLLKLPTPCVQPLLLDDAADCNNVRKVFLGVHTRVNAHIDVGIVWKLDLEHLRFFLGDDNICLSYVRDGWLVARLPFLALRIFNLSGDLRVVLVLGYCQSPVLRTSFLKEDFGRTRRNPAA